MTARDVRGFAVKFYSDEGNRDLVGNNMPVFFIQDAMKFPDIGACRKARAAGTPASNGQVPGILLAEPDKAGNVATDHCLAVVHGRLILVAIPASSNCPQ